MMWMKSLNMDAEVGVGSLSYNFMDIIPKISLLKRSCDLKVSFLMILRFHLNSDFPSFTSSQKFIIVQ
jgi:hypothetical protein